MASVKTHRYAMLYDELEKFIAKPCSFALPPKATHVSDVEIYKLAGQAAMHVDSIAIVVTKRYIDCTTHR